MLNCQVGDLAIVIHDEISENIGLIVKILGPSNWNYGERWGFVWRASLSSPIKAHQYDDNNKIIGTVIATDWADFADKDLKPIRGISKKEEIKIEEMA